MLGCEGNHQQAGLDYDETFSPIVKAATVRLVLSIAAEHKWSFLQLDVSNAFLHGSLKEQVFMKRPPDFLDSQFPSHVCLLNKSLYGLRQAPRAWLKNFPLICSLLASVLHQLILLYFSTKMVQR